MKKNTNKKVSFNILLIIVGIVMMILLYISLSMILPFKSILTETDVDCVDCNIVLISVDTLRADRVSVLGYSKNTTPAIDKLAEKSYVFTQAISVAPWTLPSHMSWFTGAYPSEHKVINKITVKKNGDEEITNLEKVSPDMKTLAEILKQNGYSTGGFTGGAGVNHQFGFDKGFDIYTDSKDFGGFSESVPKSLEWIIEHKDNKLFVFLHGYDVHGQYVPADGYDNRFLDFEYKGNLTGSKLEQKELREEGVSRGNIFLNSNDVKYLSSLYDEKVNRADAWIGVFLSEYENINVVNKTVFIITSDHGEELYEHGRIDHGHSLYEELVRIPLIISTPDLNGKVVVDKLVSNVDILPTIMSLIGYSDEFDQKGVMYRERNLLAFAYESPAAVYMETDYRYANHLRGVRNSEYKLIRDLEFGIEEVFGLTLDPGETKNIMDFNQKEVANLRTLLQDYITRLPDEQSE